MSAGRHLERCIAMTLCIIASTVATPLPKAFCQTSPKLGGQHPPAPHEIWGGTLTTDQLERALSRIGQGGAGRTEPELGELQNLLKEYFQRQKIDPNSPQIQQAMKSLVGDKDLMEKLKEIARQKQTEGKVLPTADDGIAKLLESKLSEGWVQGSSPIQPVEQPNLPANKIQQPPLMPKQAVNPSVPQPSEVGPDRLGHNSLAPKLQPNPAAGVGPPGLPGQPNSAIPPNAANVAPPQAANPLGMPNEPNDPRSKSLSALASMWEHNIGPLDETPEVKRALFDFLSGENGFDFDLQDDKGNSLWDMLKNGSVDNSALGDTLNGGSGDWKFPEFKLPNLGLGKWFDGPASAPNLGSGSSPHLRPPSLSSGGDIGNFSLETSSLATIAIAVAALVAFILICKYVQSTNGRGSDSGIGGLASWPIDPRSINTRGDLVKAFDYLSVLLCGPAAKMWTHVTIAGALADLAKTHVGTAEKLGRLYELARYTPGDEVLGSNELLESRRIICDLAGVS